MKNSKRFLEICGLVSVKGEKGIEFFCFLGYDVLEKEKKRICYDL